MPSERIVCRERNEKNERFRPVAASETAGSPRGNPEREDVRGAQANPCKRTRQRMPLILKVRQTIKF